ncbi:MAG: sugar kinase [Ruminococcaceae bacterium]|nr:sugar kinase [Oscillospiraceae bacterium]
MNKETVVAFGEIMLRLTAPETILNATEFSACYGGSESNVLAALSCMGDATRYLTKLPANDLGKGAIMHLKKHGVDCSEIITDGSNMGMYFLEAGYDTRQSRVIYARKNAEVTTLQENDFDFEKVLGDCCLFHISGISFALSASVQRLCFRLLEEAKSRNIPVSFDFNYRGKLWSVEEAALVFRKIIPYVDVVFCSERDLTAFLGLDADTFFTAYGAAKYLIVRERDIISNDRHKVQARVYTGSGCVAVSEKTFSVKERIGGGDAFTAGFLHRWLGEDADIQDVLNFAITCFVLKHTVSGDILPMSDAEISSYTSFLKKDVMR